MMGRILLGYVLLVAGVAGTAALLPAAEVKVMPGAAVFQDKGCLQCHGQNGLGTAKGPSLQGVGKRLTHDEIEKQIREGGQQMPAFGEVLEPGEIDQLADFLATWRTVLKTKKANDR